jgi:hypothetical protein
MKIKRYIIVIPPAALWYIACMSDANKLTAGQAFIFSVIALIVGACMARKRGII